MERTILFLRRIRIMKNIKKKDKLFCLTLFFFVRKQHRSIFIQYEKKKIVTILAKLFQDLLISKL